MAGNSKGSYRSKRENRMAAYDKLPPTARQALANAAFSWAPQPIRTRWNKGVKGYRNGQEIAAQVALWDAEKIAKDRRRVWGIRDNACEDRVR